MPQSETEFSPLNPSLDLGLHYDVVSSMIQSILYYSNISAIEYPVRIFQTIPCTPKSKSVLADY